MTSFHYAMKLIKPRLITFDVTGTLLMTKLVEHYESIGLRYGLTIDSSKLAPSFKINYKRLLKEHPIYGKHTGLGWENWWRTVVYNVFREQDLNVNKQTLDKIATCLIDSYGTNKCWHKYPGTNELLEYLVKQGVILGIISNFDERLESILNGTSIRSYFSFVITSYGLGIEKPNPLIFNEALKLSKNKCGVNILPEEAVHVGDTVDSDYFGAKKAGWNAILINHNANAIDAKDVPKNNIVPNLEELKTRFSEILEQ